MAVLGLFLLSACQPSDQTAADELNNLSYAWHYRNIDSTEYYARRALDVQVEAASAEALNNLAFVAIVRMNYRQADSLLTAVTHLTANQLELFVAEVQQMRLCQRRSQNRAFYEHRNRAQDYHLRLLEERDELSPRQQQRLLYAETEYAIVNSTYYYYVGLERQSVEAMNEVDFSLVKPDQSHFRLAEPDTAQYLNYLYNMGAGGMLTDGTAEQIYRDEMDLLTHCLTVAQRGGYVYFEAQAKEGLADHTGDLQLAEEALEAFRSYGDVYQIAGAHRTLASCYHAKGDDMMALQHLQLALADTVINQAPDLVASIREQLSVAYAAVGDKPQSDFNRNLYLDLQEQTRQDRELEARAAQYEKTSEQLNWMLLAVMGGILLLLFVLWLFNHLNKKEKENHVLDDLLDERREQLAEARLRVEQGERRHLQQRAKVSLAMGILPLIDRIRHAAEKYSENSAVAADSAASAEDLQYIRELTDDINRQNDLLTQWIQLRQGELNLHIESFALQQLFDLLGRSRTGFQLKDVELRIEPTAAVVKADRVLTLFMLNTLADNARKFTSAGGTVTVSADERERYVEVSVSDTGQGMSAEQAAHVFDYKPIRDDAQSSPLTSHLSPLTSEQGHGFGLMNCRGIIEKYSKLSSLFSVCMLSVESEEGRGSRFFFRLPKGIQRVLLLLTILSPLTSHLSPLSADSALSRAHIYADSAYFCNVNGHYERTLLYADSCRECLNAHYRQQQPRGQRLMVACDENSQPAEIEWLHEGLETNYQIILDIRNESAVAALALNDWALYKYNNKVYTQLFKELSADASLADYCRTMQQSQQNKRIAVILLLVMLVMIVPAYYLLYYRHRLYRRFNREAERQDALELLDDELRRAELENNTLHVANSVLDNCLSTLKHETMYYPSRIRQLIDTGQQGQLTEVASYYRDLYAILIRQAMQQASRIPLHLRRVELYGQPVLGDENLLRYLFEMISGEKLEVRGERIDIQAEARDDKYVVYTIPLTSRLSPLTSLCLRQIVRDHAEATNRHGCGITQDNEKIIIILPRYNGKV